LHSRALVLYILYINCRKAMVMCTGRVAQLPPRGEGPQCPRSTPTITLQAGAGGRQARTCSRRCCEPMQRSIKVQKIRPHDSRNEYRKHQATFHASPPSGASQHPASTPPAPLGATPQPRQSASWAALQAASRSPDRGGSRAAGRRMMAAGSIAISIGWRDRLASRPTVA
jgi:hypothetical protein